MLLYERILIFFDEMSREKNSYESMTFINKIFEICKILISVTCITLIHLLL